MISPKAPPPEATEDRVACECEHESHDRGTGTGHPYGVRLPASHMKHFRTHWGVYRLCPACATGCLASYIQPEEPK